MNIYVIESFRIDLVICSYGISQLRSPQRQPANKNVTTFSALQERAKQYFNDTGSTENVQQLLQLIEDFCREGDKLIEEEKQIKKDLQEQVRCPHLSIYLVLFLSSVHTLPLRFFPCS